MKRYRLLAASMLAIAALTLNTPLAAQTTPKGKATTSKSTAPKAAVLDINTASKADIAALPGIGDALSDKIIAGRPYTRKDQLVSKNIIPKATYDKIKDQIVAKRPKK